MSFLSKNIEKVNPSPTLAIDAKAKAMKAAGEDIIIDAGEAFRLVLPPGQTYI